MNEEAPAHDLVTRSLALLLVWYAGLGADPAIQRGEIAASRNALVGSVAATLRLSGQQRSLGKRSVQRGREVLEDLARRQLRLHALVAAGNSSGRRAVAELACALDRILAAGFSVANELAGILTPSQRHALDSLPLGPMEIRWFVELVGVARVTGGWRSSPMRARDALDDLAVPSALARLTLQHMASSQTESSPPAHDLRPALLWLSSHGSTASRSTGRCLETKLLRLVLLCPAFPWQGESPATSGWVSPAIDSRHGKENVS
jgi:hypothetical protein